MYTYFPGSLRLAGDLDMGYTSPTVMIAWPTICYWAMRICIRPHLALGISRRERYVCHLLGYYHVRREGSRVTNGYYAYNMKYVCLLNIYLVRYTYCLLRTPHDSDLRRLTYGLNTHLDTTTIFFKEYALRTSTYTGFYRYISLSSLS
jgi:hypothetical protein